MKKTLIAIPCYNCAQQASRLAVEIDHFLSTFNISNFHIEKVIFIDNNSSDNTVLKIQETLSRLKNKYQFSLWANTCNLGLGGTHKVALQWLITKHYDHLVFIHGDNQADIRDLPILLSTSAKNNFSTVLGSRFLKKSRLHNYSKIRVYGNRSLNLIYSILLTKDISDLGSGLNLFAKKDFLNNTFLLQYDDGFTFNMDLLIYLSTSTNHILFAPISWKSADEKSNASTFRVGLKSLIKIITWKVLKDRIWSKQAPKRTYISRCIYDPQKSF